MSTLPDIMSAIANRIRDQIDIEDPKVEVADRMIPSPTALPTIDIYPATPPRTQEEAGFSDIDGAIYLTVRARVDTGDNDAAQDFLLRLLDDEDLSLSGMFIEDPTIAGAVSSCQIRPNNAFGVYRDIGGEGAYLGCDWQARILR